MDQGIQHFFSPHFPLIAPCFFHIPATLSTDYVAPGIGGLIELHTFNIPLYGQKNIYAKEKKTENQEGGGQTHDLKDEDDSKYLLRQSDLSSSLQKQALSML